MQQATAGVWHYQIQVKPPAGGNIIFHFVLALLLSFCCFCPALAIMYYYKMYLALFLGLLGFALAAPQGPADKIPILKAPNQIPHLNFLSLQPPKIQTKFQRYAQYPTTSHVPRQLEAGHSCV